MKVLAVIIARSETQSIPRMNVKLLNNKPLIYYSVTNALKCGLVDDVVVGTDDEEINYMSQSFGANVVLIDKDSMSTETPMDSAVFYTTSEIEKRKNTKYDIVVTLQTSSPMLTLKSLEEAIKRLIEQGKDTIISVKNRPSLSWREEGDKVYPNYQKRVIRSRLPKDYVETGAFLITKREYVKENNRIGDIVALYELEDNEGIQIININDWIICDTLLKKKKIVFRCDGYKKIGMGHIYHCLTLAQNLNGHEVIFAVNPKYVEGVKKVIEAGIKYVEVKDNQELYTFLKEYQADIFINDRLDTTEAYIKRLKSLVKRVVTIEDLGDGHKFADVTINAVYDGDESANIYYGEQYISLRNEFLITSPKEFSPEVKNVLIVFGGTDPANLTRKIYNVINREDMYTDILFTIITGIGYNCEEKGILPKDNITVLNNVRNISFYMKQADIAFTSQGRTIYELATLGVPAIVLAQNKRETLHTFAEMKNGFINLGLGKNISEETIKNTFEWLVQTPQLRGEMRRTMLKKDMKNGISKEINLILEI